VPLLVAIECAVGVLIDERADRVRAGFQGSDVELAGRIARRQVDDIRVGPRDRFDVYAVGDLLRRPIEYAAGDAVRRNGWLCREQDRGAVASHVTAKVGDAG